MAFRVAQRRDPVFPLVKDGRAKLFTTSDVRRSAAPNLRTPLVRTGRFWVMIQRMHAYKFLRRDRTTLLTGFQWPSEEWVEAEGPLAWCENGIHACRLDDLPHWLGPELWAMELAGETVAAADCVVARRARLLDRIDAWSGGVAREFADSCAQRASALATRAPSAAGRAADAVADAASGWVAGAAYVAAAVAAEVACGTRTGALYQRHFLAERSHQAQWIRDRLALSV